MNPTARVNEVLKRLGAHRTATAHKSSLYDVQGIGCEVLHRNESVEVVWSFRKNRAAALLNHERADQVERQLRASGRTDIHRRRCDVNDYVGLSIAVPATPTSAFFDEVAREAQWVLRSVDVNAWHGV